MQKTVVPSYNVAGTKVLERKIAFSDLSALTQYTRQ